MSKYLKSLITACLVVCMTVCLGIFAAACTDDSGNGGGNNTPPTSVSVTVLLDDGTPAVDVSVQICTVETGVCKRTEHTNAQGIATIAIAESDGNDFEVHITNIPDTYAYYSYVDANGNPYATGTGALVDITKSANVTVKLAVVTSDKLSEGSNIVKLDAITDTFEAKANIESAGWYKLSSTNAYKLSGTGFELTNDNNQVNIYLKPDDELTFTFTDENELVFTVGLTKLDADGTEAKPLPAVIGSQYVIALEADKTVYITNDTINRDAAELDVTGTNFKATYDGYNYTESFTIDAPYYEEGTNNLVPQTIEVGTTEGTAGVVTLYFGAHVAAGSMEDPIIGSLDTQVDVDFPGGWDGVFVKFVLTNPGTYVLTYSADAFIGAVDGEFEGIDDANAGSIEFELDETKFAEENEYVLLVSVASSSMDAKTVSITISEKAEN